MPLGSSNHGRGGCNEFERLFSFSPLQTGVCKPHNFILCLEYQISLDFRQGVTMPLLAQEPTVSPHDLFDLGQETFASDSQWWVLHTRPRQEKALARQLLEHRASFYLPIVSKRVRQNGRNLTSHIPLFPGYLFLLANREQRSAAMTTNRIVQTLIVPSQETLWRDLRQVHRLISSGAPVTPEERLGPGSPVEISSGPLAGLRGKIVRTASGRRFVVEVDFIQRGASVLLDDCCLVPCR